MNIKQQGMTGQWSHSAEFTLRRRSVMLKLSMLIGIPSIIIYLASSHSQLLDNILYIFVLSVAALLLAILSHIGEKSGL